MKLKKHFVSERNLSRIYSALAEYSQDYLSLQQKADLTRDELSQHAINNPPVLLVFLLVFCVAKLPRPAHALRVGDFGFIA